MLIELDPDVDRIVRALARAQGITVEELVARAVRDFCRRQDVPVSDGCH